jgi:drug/metabolite transporter (DMT)-like permease
VPSSASLALAVAALGTAIVAYGVGSLLQAMAARKYPTRHAAVLMLSPLVLGGLALDVLGFLCGAIALTELPLFFVQGATSASILVTALLASLVLGERPDRRETSAMPLVLGGLVALALAAEPGRASVPPWPLTVGLVFCVPLVAGAGWWCFRRPGRLTATGLAMLAGVSYGCASLAARGLSAPHQSSTWLIPTLGLTAAHALLGVVLVTVAMRRAPVNTVTSVLFATEAVGPAAVGLVLLGDRIADGALLALAAGCVLLVAATVLLTTGADEEPATVAPEPPAGRQVVPRPGPVTDFRGVGPFRRRSRAR